MATSRQSQGRIAVFLQPYRGTLWTIKFISPELSTLWGQGDGLILPQYTLRLLSLHCKIVSGSLSRGKTGSGGLVLLPNQEPGC